jgi:hypothetical protein
MPEVIQSFETATIAITIDPASVSIDAQGRVQLKDARILQAVMAANPAGGLTRDAAQNLLCPTNGYQCFCPQK